MNRDKLKQGIKFSTTVIIIAIIIAFAIFTVLKYNVEGEKNMPFKLGKIIVISSAVTTEKIENDEEKIAGGTPETSATPATSETPTENYIWQEQVVQTNDVYIYIDKNENYKNQEIIKSVKIDNITILENVKVGKIQIYMPNSLNDGIYKYVNEFLVNSTLTYKGAEIDNKKNLEIGNQGGCVCISFANVGLGEYKSNDDIEIQQGAYILEKMQVANEDLKFKVAFDLIIEVEGKSYKTNLKLDLPVKELVGQRETHMEITDFTDVIFKRL